MELNRPAPDSGPPGRFAALRPVLRLAIRLTKARRGSTALIIGLLAVPLIAATVSLAVLRSLNPTHAEQIRMEFGEADMRMYGPLGPTADTLPQGSRVGILSRLSGTVRVGNSAATVPIVSTGGDHDLVRSRSSLSSGLWPAGADEAAVTSTVAAAQGVGIGQTIVVDGRSYRVVGIYQALRNRQAREVQVQRTDARATVSETLVALPGHRDSERVAADLAQGGATMMTHADVETEGGAATSAATLTQWSVIMIEIALLIGSVFAVIRTGGATGTGPGRTRREQASDHRDHDVARRLHGGHRHRDRDRGRPGRGGTGPARASEQRALRRPVRPHLRT